jgi:hypothetical protein
MFFNVIVIFELSDNVRDDPGGASMLSAIVFWFKLVKQASYLMLSMLLRICSITWSMLKL